MSDKFKLTVYIEKALAVELKHKAVDEGKTVSELVNSIFEKALSK